MYTYSTYSATLTPTPALVVDNTASARASEAYKQGRIKRGCSQKPDLQIGGKTGPRHIQNTGRVPFGFGFGIQNVGSGGIKRPFLIRPGLIRPGLCCSKGRPQRAAARPRGAGARGGPLADQLLASIAISSY